MCVHAGVMDCTKADLRIVELIWDIRPKRVKAPYMKTEYRQQDPKYRETRGTSWEDRGTTP